MNRIGRAIVSTSNAVDSVCLTLAKAALVGMVAAIAVQVVARYGLRAPPSWTEELARYLMVWGGLLGASAAFRRGIDPAVTRRDETGNDRAAWFAKIALALSVLIFLLPILYYSFFGAGFDWSRSFLMRNLARTSSGLGVNLIFVAVAIPTFCIVILIHLAARIVAGPLQPKATHAPDIV